MGWGCRCVPSCALLWRLVGAVLYSFSAALDTATAHVVLSNFFCQLEVTTSAGCTYQPGQKLSTQSPGSTLHRSYDEQGISGLRVLRVEPEICDLSVKRTLYVFISDLGFLE